MICEGKLPLREVVAVALIRDYETGKGKVCGQGLGKYAETSVN